MLRFALVISCCLVLGVAQGQQFLSTLFAQTDSEILQEVYTNPQKYEMQLIYTRINRDENNKPSFDSEQYNVNPDQYFYPASTVKMPIAFLAMEKLNQLQIEGLDKNATMLSGKGRVPQTASEQDTSSATGLPSVGHYVRKIFLVSDNDAYNRLYEFLGQRYINEQLRAKGFEETRIKHRLSLPEFGPEENMYTNPVSFYKDDQLLFHKGEVYSHAMHTLKLQGERKGKAYQNGEGKIVNEPFDFTQKNFISLQDLHDMLQVVLFPNSMPQERRFELTGSDYRFLYKAMSQTPRSSDYPKYDHSDSYVKFWVYGDDTTKVFPKSFRIFNKVGWAYGYLTDVSYIIDAEAGVEFIVAATIHVNENETFNDGVYEYETKGLPFFAELGKLLYEYEKKRKRPHKPDLSRFLVE